MKRVGARRSRRAGLASLILCAFGTHCAWTQTNDADLIERINAAVYTRYEHVAGFTDVEHYAVFRGKDQAHPAAEMTVKVTYRKGAGKSYVVLSQSGSQVVQRFGLRPLLENEKKINDPATVRQSWFTSDNYEMRVKPEKRLLGNRQCVAVAIAPRRKAPNMIDGTLWVDARDGSIVQVEGIASKSPSVFAGATRMMRQYAEVSGYAMATHARAESASRLFGRTVVVIDYSEYHLKIR